MCWPENSDPFALCRRVYIQNPDGERRYSPAEVTHAEKIPVMGNPDPAKICTSHVGHQNLTIRLQMRRLTRFTNAFGKNLENLVVRLLPALRLLQLLPDSLKHTLYPGDGIRNHAARLEFEGFACGLTRSIRPEQPLNQTIDD